MAKKLLGLKYILIKWIWVPKAAELKERVMAKDTAHQELLSTVILVLQAARLTIIACFRLNIIKKVDPPLRIGKAIRELDCALLGLYTKIIYNNFSKDNARIITQLHTGDTKLNLFLARIKATKELICVCGVAPESIRYFLFSCRRWVY